MKTTLTITLLLILSAFTISAIPQQSKQWEYKFEYKMNEKKANDLGSQGWELSAIESTSGAGIATNIPVYVFKRVK